MGRWGKKYFIVYNLLVSQAKIGHKFKVVTSGAPVGEKESSHLLTSPSPKSLAGLKRYSHVQRKIGASNTEHHTLSS